MFSGARGSVIVVGGGVIGLSVAWRAASAGFAVSVLDPAPASGASAVAGGMLAPVTEAWPGEEALLELGSASLRRWPEFASELTAASGRDAGLREEGTLVVAVDAADRAELLALAEHLSSLGRHTESLTGKQIRSLEPSIGSSVRSGLSVPGDLAVDNRMVLAALRAVCEVESVRVAEVGPGTVRLSDGTARRADVVVLAAGAWSGQLYEPLRHVVRPVKGEILRLRATRSTLPPPSRTVRCAVQGNHVYLVPRDDGGLVVGATQYEAGFDTTVTAGGVRDLLRWAELVLPSISEYEFVESAAGLRPASIDNLPVIREFEPGLVVATGHHRNGMLLAPITADLVLAHLEGKT
ncbi:glycine oxidase ThiO [Allokutzneria sp. A3M-2-11 16]|uniref:glycine oxidase ThiO n=1 Tax=Allokutzneria sp. A3M-2-11 16 TaxID=2962043 RepID=UPI0020B6D2D1|nr:glycine oxidase ThiO [Allokutzneria sp. A3M-2-11 16]MCP3800042.1 glycine oxidase ThiO [Allokutzneria sp. A3M-2-11 16]